jgi:hypothetical protein
VRKIVGGVDSELHLNANFEAAAGRPDTPIEPLRVVNVERHARAILRRTPKAVLGS